MSMPRLAITLGDPAGIGPELALKAALDPDIRALCVPVLVGDRVALELHAAASGLAVEIVPLAAIAEADAAVARGAVALLDLGGFHDQPPRLGQAAAGAIRAAMAGEVAAVVACPQTEIAIHEAGIPFDGYPSFVARITGTPIEDAFLMLCFDATRIVHTTLHVSLAQAIALITRERVGRVIAATHATLVRLGIATPRIAVSGLNPHAGEHGMFGREEIETIEPAIRAARAAGMAAEGPFGADTMFRLPGYDAFVVMYHDQGHLAAKLLATNRTAGLTIGTPILFSSVAHGSALDIAGQNRASPAAVIEAIRRLAGACAQQRE